MKPESATYSRRSIRLKGYDYSSAGAYFVTICARDRECLFGDIVHEEMRPSEGGNIADPAFGGSAGAKDICHPEFFGRN